MQHVMKKIRNGLMKSGTQRFSRKLLTCQGYHIIWLHWIKAYEYDLNHHLFRQHYKLTRSHLYPTRTERMRNHLSLEVLDSKMLSLMKVLLFNF